MINGYIFFTIFELQFAVLLCMIFVLQLGVGVASYILRTEVEDFLHTNMLRSMHNYNSSHPGVYKTWNVIQHEVGHGSLTQVFTPSMYEDNGGSHYYYCTVHYQH